MGQQMTKHVGALDGGGTKTLGAIASRAGDVTYTAPLSGCNPQDNPDWQRVLGAALAQFPPCAHLTLGLPGYGEIPRLDAAVKDFASASPHKSLTCMNDVELAYRGAFPTGGGVLVLAGTGSMAMASDGTGIRRVGGWGDLFGDEGSAFWIGRRGLQWASQMRDGRREDTGFAGRLAVKLGIDLDDGPFGFSSWAQDSAHPRSRVAQVSICINDLSDEGDVAATNVLRAAAEQLANHASAVARLASLPRPWQWTYAGSVFRSTTLLRRVADLIGPSPVAPQMDALGGGLWLSAKAAGWPVDAHWAARVKAGLDRKTTDPAPAAAQ